MVVFHTEKSKASWFYPLILPEGLCFKSVLLEVETPKTGIIFELYTRYTGNVGSMYQLFFGTAAIHK